MICYEAFRSVGILGGMEFLLAVDYEAELLTEWLAEFAAVLAECVTIFTRNLINKTINEHQGETKDYNHNYLLHLFIGNFSCSVTQFDERTLGRACRTPDTKNAIDADRYQFWQSGFRFSCNSLRG